MKTVQEIASAIAMPQKCDFNACSFDPPNNFRELLLGLSEREPICYGCDGHLLQRKSGFQCIPLESPRPFLEKNAEDGM